MIYHRYVPRFDPWVGKISWRRKWQSTPVFLPGEPHRQRSLAGCSLWGAKSRTQISLEHILNQILGHAAGVAELLGVGKKPHIWCQCRERGSCVRVKEKHRRRSIGLLSPYIL